jgi:hypothetical protein
VSATDETVDDGKVVPTTGTPCSKCPWRTANQGTPHPHGFYTKANLRRLWGGMRKGVRMTCHPTDPRMAEFEGYEGTAKAPETRECAGALILIQREMDRVQDAMRAAEADGTKDGVARYRAENARGLSRDGIVAHFEAAVFGGIPMIGGLKMGAVDLNHPDIGYDQLEPWTPKQQEN